MMEHLTVPLDTTTPCLIKSSYGPDKPAFFQEWGRSVAYDEGNHPFQVSVGIVVMQSSGETRKVDPEDITFVDQE